MLTFKQFLNEKVYDINDDVDMLYDMFFADFVKALNGKASTTRLEKLLQESQSKIVSTKYLTNEYSKQAHEKKPVLIAIRNGNHYDPKKRLISISVNMSAFDAIKTFGDIVSAKEVIETSMGKDKADEFVKEFSVGRIKGSIHHELAHWIDDALLTNKQGKGRVENIFKSSTNSSPDYKRITQGYSDVGLTDYEIQAQVHSIIQIKREHGDKWDTLTFDDMIKLSPPLIGVQRKLKTPKEIKLWRKLLLRRLNREGLLGAKMR